MDDLEDSKLKQDLRCGNPTTGQSIEEVSSIVQPGEDLFQLQTELSDAFEPPPIQRTSTPTDDKELLFTHFDLGEASENGLAPNKEAEGSPVLNAEGNTNERASINHKTLVSSGEVSNENSLEASHSLYASALSNINDTKTSNRYSLRGNSKTQSNELSSSALQETIHVESWSESVTQDSAWATACGSEQDFSESDVKDTTVTGQELESRNEPIELKDNPVTYYDSMEKSVTESEQGDESRELTYNTSENNATINDGQDHQLEEDCSNLKIMDAEEDSISQTPPDLDLLNEICEEATSMTIKEALICSLKPGVRAGLSEGRLLLSESEVMALEQYCEHFIDNLFSELLDGQWMEAVDEEAGSHDPVDDKAVIARKLSDISLDTLKANCDRFVHSIITESIHNSCFGSELKDVNPHETSEVSPNKPEQGALDKNSVKDVLPLFQGSESIQQYIGLLTADLIKSALANLSSPAATGNVEKNVPLLFNENNASCENTSKEVLTCLSEDMGEIQNQTANNDSTKSDRDASPNVAFVNKSNSVQLVEKVEDDIDELCMEDTAELSEEEEILSGSFTCALETSLEFDIHDDWEGGDLQFESLLPEAETKQKIMLRELSFDEHADIAGTELLAPVFLAIAEENDDDSEFQGMRKKAQSIENLCGIIEEQAVEEPRQRSFSAPKKISLTQPMPDVLSEVSQTDEEEIDVYGSDSGDDNESEVEKEEEETREQAASPDEGSNGDRFRWHTVSVNRRDKVLDLKLLEPYMKVISHGGYFSDTKATIVVIAACYLPDKTIKNYKFLMEQLFFYVVSTLELLAIHEDYYLVYLNGGTRQQNMPTVAWMKRFYQHIEGGLKKRMKEMFIVHPNFWLKTVIRLSKPFINLNFWRKLSFVQSLQSLNSFVPIDYIYIPDEVMRVDPGYRVAHNR